MMFEVRGVWESRTSDTRQDRINQNQLRTFRKGLGSRPKTAIQQLVVSDQYFRANTLQAYADAWTLSFFLSETRPTEYSNYLARVSARKAFSTYSARSRLGDFKKAFGGDLEVLEVHLRRFVKELGEK